MLRRAEEDPRRTRFRGRIVSVLGTPQEVCRRRSDFKLLSSWATVGSIVGVRRNCTSAIREQKEVFVVMAFPFRDYRFSIVILNACTEL